MKKWIFGAGILAMILAFVFIATTQTKPTITKTKQVALILLAKPDFTLEVTPVELHSPIARVATYQAEVTAIETFSGEIVVSVNGLPAGFIVEFVPSNTFTVGTGQTKGAQINITVPDDEALIGQRIDFTVTASSDTYN